jgi:dihydroorotate dehydrogenase (NAD+) catalytic subunit
MNKVDLIVNIAGIEFSNPIMNASGCFDPESMFRVEGMDLAWLGAIVSKGTTFEPRAGNPQPRICEHRGGMVNWIGLENPGIDEVLATKVPFMAQFGVPVILNISGFTVEEFAIMAEKATGAQGVSALEVNISCPNVHGGKIPFGCDPDIAAQVTAAVRAQTGLPVIVKLTPNVSEDLIGKIAQAVVNAGADAISLINTVKVENVGGIIVGGWSGRPIKPTALKLIKIVRQAVAVPIIGMGGIYTLYDVIEFLKAGCQAVAIGTANFSNPLVMMELIDGLEKYCLEKGLARLSEIVAPTKF